jgi:tetrapyrrole methylase family protein/MazG family protein
MDALEVAARLHPPIDPDSPALLGQLYSRDQAGDVKLTLMNLYPDEHPLKLVHGAGTDGELVESIPLYELDHSRHISHLTTLYLPPLSRTSGFASFQETIARLRGPGGCPWDQVQTHQSLRQGLVEETAEVLDALDAKDLENLREELGDLLLHILLHAQIAAEEGDFTAADVVAGIEAKIRRRHPHVFDGVRVDGVGQVLTNWEAIKQEEKGDRQPGSALEGVPGSLPALAQAYELAGKAGKAGFEWPHLDRVAAVREAMAVLEAAGDREEQEGEMGDLLFALVNWSRWLGIDPEVALRMANRRFRQRFQALERAVEAKGKSLDEIDPEALLALWQAVRNEGGI